MPPALIRFFAPVAIPNVLRVLAGFEALMFVLMLILGPTRAPLFMDRLILDFDQVMRGEVWRLISFLAVPAANPFSNFGILWMVFAIMFLFMINDILDNEWGAHGLSAFFYTGVLCCILAAGFAWVVMPDSSYSADIAAMIPSIFAISCLMAAGTVAPHIEIRLFFVIPVTLAVVAGISGAFLLLTAFTYARLHPLLMLVPLICVANYLIWVLPGVFRKVAHASATHERRKKFEKASISDSAAFHTCESCGATEKSHPEREFRVTKEGQEKCDACRGDNTPTAP